jgi:hypothetical protein
MKFLGWRSMVKLEIGPGYSKKNRGYTFNPYYHPDYDTIYLDIMALNAKEVFE